ncbi:cell wall integrity and stress response component 1 [Phoenix dactylifera]|uniref:Cell wall integrity and stress response component 1 n=1 Tax=Phoenix dactylifera TaxID=42345 RepID=A0A8B8J9B7_PHODC|nr:cell wall integrity and stress response component 1 [Phoenix dactylifera]
MDRHHHHHRHRRHHHHHNAGHQVSSFNLSGCMKLPQIKDTTTKITPGTATSSSCPPPKKNHHRGRHHFVTADPSSPKIGCMGQIKRKSKSSSSTTTTSSSSSSSSSSYSPSLSTSSSDSKSRNKLFGLKRAFMARSVGSQASSKVRDDRGGVSMVVNVADLDPPLPVVRRRPGSDGNSVGLWERRCGGEALAGLQLEQPRLYLYASVL